jgi:hypothetical protein
MHRNGSLYLVIMNLLVLASFIIQSDTFEERPGVKLCSQNVFLKYVVRSECEKELTSESFLNVSQKATTTPIITISIRKVLVRVTNKAVRGLA